MTTRNATYDEKLSSTASLCVLYCTGLICSGLVLILTFRSHLYKTRVNLLLANVALADTLLSISCLILQPPNIMAGNNAFFCDWSGFITYATGLEASWFVPVVVMNRYISIFHSNVFKKIYTTRNIIFMIIGGWLVAVAFVTPFQLGGVAGFEDQYLNCGINTKEAHPIWGILVYVLVVAPTFLGNGITAFCNFRIFLKLREHAKTDNRILKNTVMSQNRQLMYATLLHTLFAVCLQSPYILGKLFPVIVEDNPLRQIFPCLYIFNGTINPLTTLYVVKPYRKAFLSLLRCQNASQIQPQIPSVMDRSTRRGAQASQMGFATFDIAHERSDNRSITPVEVTRTHA